MSKPSDGPALDIAITLSVTKKHIIKKLLGSTLDREAAIDEISAAAARSIERRFTLTPKPSGPQASWYPNSDVAGVTDADRDPV